MALATPAHLKLDTQNECGVRTARAFDRLRQHGVAIKRATGTAPVEALEHEWRLLKQLSPGPFVTPIEFGRAGAEDAYLTSRWVDGESFESYAGRHAGLEVYAIAQQALLGLARLHRAGYVHGDPRPENLLVGSQATGPRAHWLDLEHASRYGSLSAGFSYTESWRNNAPESGEAQNPRVDLLAFGELLGYSLEATPDSDSTWIVLLREFASKLCDSFGRAQIGNAEEARYALADLAAGREAEAPDPVADSIPPVPVINRRAEHWWRHRLADWRQKGGRLAVRVSGPRGCGKTTFLRLATADAAASGHAVLDLLNDSHEAPFAAADAEMLRGYLGGAALPPVLALGREDVDSFVARFADALPETALLLVEMPADPTAGDNLPRPHGCALDDWSFPSLSSREWFQWVGASI